MKTYRSHHTALGIRIVMVIVAIVTVGGIGALIEHQLTSSRSRVRVRESTSPTVGSKATTSTPPAPIRLSSITPADGTKQVSPTAPITLAFSSELSPHVVDPTISPATPGTWSQQANTLAFTPSAAFSPLSDVTVSIPSGADGIRGRNGGELTTSVVDRFQIENGSVLRLLQLLALLDYAPLSWSPTGPPIASNATSAQLNALFAPPAGSFSWIATGWPRRLLSMWRPGSYNSFTKGLVMSFEADHGLTPDGAITATLWTDLLQALQSNLVNTGGYNYALADKRPPESFTVWHDAKIVLKSSANTGIAASPTPNGTFPVYTRLRRQVMRGTNPNGTKYADLVQYIAYFHGNDAVHYMDRADYGIPQSLGCVELPLADAARAWPYLAYGTLVTVIS